jgi:EH_Signature domain
MTLLDALRARSRIRTVDIRPTQELDDAVTAIKAAFPGYDKTPRLALNEIIQMLGSNLLSWQWSGVKVGDVALAAHAVFTEGASAPGPVKEFLQREILATTNSALLQATCEGYIAGWERDSTSTAFLGEAIESRSQYLPGNWKKAFRNLPELFDTQDAPARLAARMVSERDAFEWLVSNGVAAPHSGQLMRQVQSAWLSALPDAGDVKAVEQLFFWIFPKNHPALDGELAAAAIEKVLQPWLGAQPAHELKELVVHRVVEEFGDPRTQRPEFWALVSSAHRKVIVRWLAGASIDALLAVITKSTANHMWPPRHVFWKSLYDKGYIEEAWVALSPIARSNAADMFERTSDPVYTMTGLQVAKSRKDTCLLIMRIGRFTVVEGSHDYRIHVFHSSDPDAPSFYEDEYNAENIILAVNHPDTRIHDAYGHWQKWVEQRVLR